MTRFHIRQAHIDDQAIISHMNAALALETESLELNPSLSTKGVEAVLADVRKGFYLLCGHYENGREAVAGQLLCLPEWSDWRAGDYWWIQSVYVVPQHRRQGVFRTLLNALHKMSKGKPHVIGLRLYVEQKNQLAHQVYRDLGFQRSTYEIYER